MTEIIVGNVSILSTFLITHFSLIQYNARIRYQLTTIQEMAVQVVIVHILQEQTVVIRFGTPSWEILVKPRSQIAGNKSSFFARNRASYAVKIFIYSFKM